MKKNGSQESKPSPYLLTDWAIKGLGDSRGKMSP